MIIIINNDRNQVSAHCLVGLRSVCYRLVSSPLLRNGKTVQGLIRELLPQTLSESLETGLTPVVVIIL